MTDEQKQEFFDKVKGKKIRWSGWSYGCKWFIPSRINDDDPNKMHGEYENGGADHWYIYNGFKAHLDDRYWILEPPQPSPSLPVEQPTEFLPGDLVKIKGEFTLEENRGASAYTLKIVANEFSTSFSSDGSELGEGVGLQLELIRRPTVDKIKVTTAEGKSAMISHETAKQWELI